MPDQKKKSAALRKKYKCVRKMVGMLGCCTSKTIKNPRFCFAQNAFAQKMIESSPTKRWCAALSQPFYISIILLSAKKLKRPVCCSNFAQNDVEKISFSLVGLCYVVVKVSLLLVIEIVAFPVICGWWLDICSLALFDASLKDRQVRKLKILLYKCRNFLDFFLEILNYFCKNLSSLL